VRTAAFNAQAETPQTHATYSSVGPAEKKAAAGHQKARGSTAHLSGTKLPRFKAACFVASLKKIKTDYELY